MESPFKPLFHSISILFIDDDPGQLQFYKDTVQEHPLYTVLTAANAANAQMIIKSGVPIHLCVLDMGINDIEHDEFYLIKKYQEQYPFIVVSGSMDMEKAFTATCLGAAGMLSKPVDVTAQKFWNTLSDVFCNWAIIPRLSSNANPQLKLCCDTLTKTLPSTVTEWAANVNISDSYLRKLWGECFQVSPKSMLLQYKVFFKAFLYHNAVHLTEINGDDLPIFGKEQITEFRHLVKAFISEKQGG